MKKAFLSLFAAGLLASAAMSSVQAADVFPAKPMRLLVGFAAGGPTDVIARVLAKDMTETLGQPVVVENKAGASSMIAIREVKMRHPTATRCCFSPSA